MLLGKLVANVTYSFPDSTCSFNDIIILDSNFLVFGGIGPVSEGFTSILICSFDFDLNLQWQQSYLLSNIHVLGGISAKIDLDNTIIVLGSALNEVKNLNSDPFGFRCNQLGDSILMFVETLDYHQWVYDFLIKHDSSGYTSFGRAHYPSYPHYEACGANYTRSFMREEVQEIPDERFNSNHTVRWINSQEFLISGKKNITVNYSLIQGAGLKRMDTLFSILDEVDFAHIIDTISYPAWGRNFDYFDINNILFSWTKNFDDLFQNMPSWIVLTKLDSNLNIIYDRYYGGDAMYSSYFIEATEDGGCIIAGIKYEYDGYNYDLYIIKTDEDGLITSIEDNYFQSTINAEVYPNPCTDRIAFDHDLTLVDIFNHSGQLVLRFQNYNQFSDIAVGKLQSGVYIYRALTKEGGFTSGKFVKR